MLLVNVLHKDNLRYYWVAFSATLTEGYGQINGEQGGDPKAGHDRLPPRRKGGVWRKEVAQATVNKPARPPARIAPAPIAPAPEQQ